jgi:hypothetical protein
MADPDPVPARFTVVALVPRASAVLVRVLDTTDFRVVLGRTTLAGKRVTGVDQPRITGPDGSPDPSVYAFGLESADDLTSFEVGQIVALETLAE